MIRSRETAGWLRRPVLAVLALLASVAVLLGALLDGGAPSRASAQAVTGSALETTPYTDDSLPLSNVTMIGSTPGEPVDGSPPAEATNETWGIGKVAGGGKVAGSEETFPYGLARYTREAGWTLGPQLLDTSGQPLDGFEPDQPSGLSTPSPLTGQMTADGSGVLVGTASPLAGATREQVLLVRNPGKGFQQTPPVPEEEAGETLLGAGEQLFGSRRAPLIAPLEEEGGTAGALVVPFDQSGENHVLHWDGSKWSREAIETPEGESVQVYGIGASSPKNAWLLASAGGEKLALYRRIGSVWKPVAPAGGEPAGAPLRVAGEALFVSGSAERVETQLLSVTSQGIWIDAERPGVQALTTVFFKPETQEAGSITGSWCSVSAGEGCEYQLPEDLPADLPTGPSRSFAWANASSAYGERVITGLREGVSLRLEGTTFKRVLALGGAAPPEGPRRELRGRVLERDRGLAGQRADAGAPDDGKRKDAQQVREHAGPVPPCPVCGRPRAGCARGGGGERGARGGRQRRGRALRAGPGLAAGKPARSRRTARNAKVASCRMAEPESRLRRWRSRPDVAMAR